MRKCPLGSAAWAGLQALNRVASEPPNPFAPVRFRLKESAGRKRVVMRFERSSGVLLHVTSLPSKGGIGDLGPAAFAFLDFLAEAHQHIWQVLPLCATGYGNSPYAATSAFAGNSFLVSLEILAEWGWISKERSESHAGQSSHVDFGEVEWRKLPLLMEAAGNFVDRGAEDPALRDQWEEFESFCREEESWLTDYALFAELRRQFNTGAWTVWPEDLRKRKPAALARVVAQHGRSLRQEQALQFAFAKQWKALRAAADRRGIRILGDVAIFVNMDSADVWVHPELFELDADFKQTRIAGVPPDYFSPTGQRWGNPLYRWDLLAEQGYGWWIERMRRARQLYDIIRLDHFRGFESYWAIPAEEETAIKGEWIKGPGAKLFAALEAELGELPLVAEDLGLITPAVTELREELGMPGMKVLQFGFTDKGAHIHLPHGMSRDTVAYTGTHDNNTTLGWWKEAGRVERAAIEAYIGPTPDKRPVWPLMRTVAASQAEIAIFPVQDLLELDAEARMNTPATSSGNWRWRVQSGLWTPALASQLAALTVVTDRDSDPLANPEEEA